MHVALYLIVFICGGCVLALEILGTRILGPFYGVSLYLWSALITVALLALSLGYLAGGRWADRGPRLERLSVAIGLAGIWTLLIPWMRTPVLGALDGLGLRAGVLSAALVLFGPPLALLGMVGPYAIRLRAHELGEVGRTAGNVYALSTLASVVAALATGFFLIPQVGVRRLTVLIGVVLLGTAVLGLLASRRGRAAALPAVLFLAAGAAGLGGLGMLSSEASGNVVHFEQSPYGEIRVVDRDGQRYLLIDGGMHTRADLETFEPRFRYCVALDVAKLFFREPGDALVVGLGGGTVARSLSASLWKVDAVEIDPVVAEVAHSHFDLARDAADVYVTDGRRFLEEHEERYDLIVLDAFGSSSIPFHLITREYFALVRSRLEPDGVVAINLMARAWDDRIVRSAAETLRQHFGNVVAMPTQEPPNTLGNVILVASDRVMEVPEGALPHPQEYLADPYLHWVVIHMNHAWDNRFEPERAGAKVLTDDLNPIDVWSEAVHIASRRQILEYFQEETLLW